MKKIFVGLLVLVSIFSCLNGFSNVVEKDKMENKKQTVVVMLGPPGSGKGTQAVELSKNLGLIHISVGDLFRDNIKRGTELGKLAESYTKKGELVPDDVTIKMLENRVKEADCKNGYVLDGSSRTLTQAKSLDAMLKKTQAKVVVLSLDVSDNELIRRINDRLVCDKCGIPYKASSFPKGVTPTCSNCHGPLSHRADDNEEVMRNRLQIYHKESDQIQKFFKEHSNFYSIDGTRSPDVIFKDLVSKIKK